MSSSTHPRSAATIRRQVVSASQQSTAGNTLPSVLPQTKTRMLPHASSTSSRTTSRPSRFQKPGSTSSASDITTTTTFALSSDSEFSASLQSLSSTQQSAATGLQVPPRSLASIPRGASRFQKPGSTSSASDATPTTTITSSSAASTSRFSRFQKSVVRPSAANTTSTIASSTGSEFTRQSLNTGSYASSSLVSEGVYPNDTHSAACAIAEDWTINSSFSIVEKEFEPTLTADIPEEVYLPPRFSSEYFTELEGKKLTVDCHLYGKLQTSAVNLARMIKEGRSPTMFKSEMQRYTREVIITDVMKITKLDDDVVKGRVANCFLDFVETAYDLTRPLPEDDDDVSTEDVAPFRQPSVEDCDRLLDAMALGVEDAFPLFRKYLLKRQEAFYANATYKSLTIAVDTRRRLRARLVWEEKQRREQTLAEERRVAEERRLTEERRLVERHRLAEECRLAKEHRIQIERDFAAEVAAIESDRMSPQPIECEMLPDGEWPTGEIDYSPEILAATKEADGRITRWINKLGACWGEEGLDLAHMWSWRWRKTVAQSRDEMRFYAQKKEEKQKALEEEQKAREQWKQPLSTIYEETENSTITSTICDTICNVSHNLVASIMRQMGYK
ncbi:hypothetical protein Q7P37_004488 [Cladosporium fusiforme]